MWQMPRSEILAVCVKGCDCMMKQYKGITTFLIMCMLLVFPYQTAEAMEETTYDYSQMSRSAMRREFAEKYRRKKELIKYRDIGETDWPLVDSVQLIYEKHYQDNPNSLPVPYCTYNAKGNFYAEVVEKSHSRIVLVYNGMSENGKCYLLVAEEEHYDLDGSMLDTTSLLEFYAVNLEEGKVYEAHKTTWGGAESEEYRKATTE